MKQHIKIVCCEKTDVGNVTEVEVTSSKVSNVAFDIAYYIHSLQESFARTDFRLTIAKAPFAIEVKNELYTTRAVATVTATRNLGTQNARVDTWLIHARWKHDA